MLLFKINILKGYLQSMPENKFLSKGGKYKHESISRISLENPVEKYHFQILVKPDLDKICAVYWLQYGCHHYPYFERGMICCLTEKNVLCNIVGILEQGI